MECQLPVIHYPFGRHPAGVGLLPFEVRRQPDTPGPRVIRDDWLMAPGYRSARTRRRFESGSAEDQSAVAALYGEHHTADLGKHRGNNTPLGFNWRQRFAGALQRVGQKT